MIEYNKQEGKEILKGQVSQRANSSLVLTVGEQFLVTSKMKSLGETDSLDAINCINSWEANHVYMLILFIKSTSCVISLGVSFLDMCIEKLTRLLIVLLAWVLTMVL